MTTQAPTSGSSTTAAPVILLLSLKKESFWDEQHASLVDTLSSKATVKRVTKASSAVTFLTNNTPSAILITDAALTESGSKYDAIRAAVVAYVRGGGTAVTGTHFSSFVKPTNLGRWFSRTWGLLWKNGDYHRTTIYLNSTACGGRFAQAGLPSEYSQKAVFLSNVDSNDALYWPSGASRIESRVFPPDPVDVQQTPVAFGKVGEGWLGYVGDVNNEDESQLVLIAMCGL